MTNRDLITEAAQEIGILGAGETLTATQAQYALTQLGRLYDLWNARRCAVYADQFLEFTFTIAANPQTIGPTGATYTATQRPVSIEGANVILSGDVRQPIALRPPWWWDQQTVPTVQATFPTDLYYNPTWPNGSLYWWPVPTVAYGLELYCRIVLSSDVGLDDVFTLPPGYREAVTLTLAEKLCRPFGRQIPPTLPEDARKARAVVFANNDQTPDLRTEDSGMPRIDDRRGDWNYLTGQFMR